MDEIETHPLAPFVMPYAQVLILGSFMPPPHRHCMHFYYPNFNNDFWRIMGAVFYDDKDHFVDVANKNFKERLIKDFLNKQGIAISDVAYQIKRLKNNASDQFLQIITYQDIDRLLRQMPNCTHIIATGQKACDSLCKQYHATPPKTTQSTAIQIDGRAVVLYRAVSSSRAYPLAFDKKVAVYRGVFGQVFN